MEVTNVADTVGKPEAAVGQATPSAAPPPQQPGDAAPNPIGNIFCAATSVNTHTGLVIQGTQRLAIPVEISQVGH